MPLDFTTAYELLRLAELCQNKGGKLTVDSAGWRAELGKRVADSGGHPLHADALRSAWAKLSERTSV